MGSFCWCSNGSQFVSDYSGYMRCSFYSAHIACASTKKTEVLWIKKELSFYPGQTCLGFMCVLGGYATSTVLLALKPLGGALTSLVESCPFSGVTDSGRVWRKVPENDVWSMSVCLTLHNIVINRRRLKGKSVWSLCMSVVPRSREQPADSRLWWGAGHQRSPGAWLLRARAGHSAWWPSPDSQTSFCLRRHSGKGSDQKDWQVKEEGDEVCIMLFL